MQPVTLAYRRARRLLRAQPVSFWTAQALAVLEVLLSLALLVAGALLVGLLVTRGAVRLSGEQGNDSPARIRGRVEASPAGEARFGARA